MVVACALTAAHWLHYQLGEYQSFKYQSSGCCLTLKVFTINPHCLNVNDCKIVLHLLMGFCPVITIMVDWMLKTNCLPSVGMAEQHFCDV